MLNHRPGIYDTPGRKQRWKRRWVTLLLSRRQDRPWLHSRLFPDQLVNEDDVFRFVECPQRNLDQTLDLAVDVHGCG